MHSPVQRQYAAKAAHGAPAARIVAYQHVVGRFLGRERKYGTKCQAISKV